jgi:hypothetical protein
MEAWISAVPVKIPGKSVRLDQTTWPVHTIRVMGGVGPRLTAKDRSSPDITIAALRGRIYPFRASWPRGLPPPLPSRVSRRVARPVARSGPSRALLDLPP